MIKYLENFHQKFQKNWKKASTKSSNGTSPRGERMVLIIDSEMMPDDLIAAYRLLAQTIH